MIVARYLACLRHLLEHVPDRRERRDLPSDKARAIVTLQSSTFLTTLSSLEQRWSHQHIPDVLYTDPEVNDMLLKLENTMIARWYPWSNGEPREMVLDWSEKFNHKGILPLPIIGLEYTLSLYFPTTPVDLSNISTLDLRERNLTGTTRHRCTATNQQCSPAGSEDFKAFEWYGLMETVSSISRQGWPNS